MVAFSMIINDQKNVIFVVDVSNQKQWHTTTVSVSKTVTVSLILRTVDDFLPEFEAG